MCKYLCNVQWKISTKEQTKNLRYTEEQIFVYVPGHLILLTMNIKSPGKENLPFHALWKARAVGAAGLGSTCMKSELFSNSFIYMLIVWGQGECTGVTTAWLEGKYKVIKVEGEVNLGIIFFSAKWLSL